MVIEKTFVNHLSKEKSPYLLEHATNPVDWYPWSESAFEKAKIEKKMIFVSIGYSACHWCHVMRRESFENEEVAKILNENFISIKVDREERPDIDHLLQITFQIMNGRGGGWPLSIFMTPDKKPFYSGTYFPLDAKFGMPGFIDVLKAVIKAFQTKQQEVNAQANQVETYIKNIQGPKTPVESNNLSSSEIIKSFTDVFDNTNGGFGHAPKFPTETGLYLLLHQSAFIQDKAGLNVVFKTLDAMIQGGIYDQLGGGFHRYSVDEKWLVPHFEKMLYNQSLLVLVLVEAFRISKKKMYLETIVDTLEYVAREMQSSSGGFYSSQNADSEGVEGKYFVWEKKELEILEKDSKAIVCDYFDVSEHGNWEGKNILHIQKTIEHLSERYKKSQDQIREIVANSKKIMFEIREKRIKPTTDNKIITSWNALMIKAYLSAYRVTSNIEQKENLLMTVKHGLNHLQQMIEGDVIYRVFIEDKKSIEGFLDDFQYTISAFLDYYELSLDEIYLERAKGLFKYSIENFYDKEHGGFYYSLSRHDTIITRFKDTLDSPLPSPVAYAVHNCARLAFFDMESEQIYNDILKKTLLATNYSPRIDIMSQASMIYVQELIKNHFTEITVMMNNKKDSLTQNQLLNDINSEWVPFRIQIQADISKVAKETLEKEFLAGKNVEKGEIQVYICQNYVCSKPFSKKEDILLYLSNIYPNSILNN